ncbi:MAG: HAMP domain-containing protein [Oligoflexia bacterium]|nr:HAMP domain-containing protein [Oligoflexia bacterium]
MSLKSRFKFIIANFTQLKLKNKLVALLLANFLLITIAGGYVFINTYYQRSEKVMLDRIEGLGLTFKNIIDEILQLDVPLDKITGISEKCIQFVKDNKETLDMLIIRDAKSKIIYSSKKKELIEAEKKKEYVISQMIGNSTDFLYNWKNVGKFYVVELPIIKDKNTVGFVQVASNQQKLIDEIYRFALAFLPFILVIVSTTVLIIFFLQRVVIRPLYKVVEATREVKKGNLLIQIEESGLAKDEIGELAISFNQMIQQLKRQVDEIKDYSKNLELKVQERTEELRQKNVRMQTLFANIPQAVFSITSDRKIIPPVSDFSKIIFGEDVTDKNIFECLYKDLNKGSQDFAMMKTAMLAVFNNNSMQWMLMEDNFPKRLVLNLESEKILKVSTNPIYDSKENVEQIMYVIEDVTLMEKMELEIKKQKEENTKRMQILQELAAQNPKDLRVFFTSAFKLIDLNYKLIKQMPENNDLISELFRNFHTIKGNSRVFSLGMISDIVHDVESKVVELRKHLGTTDYDIERELAEIKKGNEQSSAIIQEYSEYAEKLFKIENEYKIKGIWAVHNDYVYLDWFLNSVYNDEKRREQSKEKVLEIVNQFEENVRKLGKETLTNSLNGFIESCKDERDNSNIQNMQKFMIEMGAFLKYAYINSSFFKPYSFDLDGWVGLFREIYKVTETYYGYVDGKVTKGYLAETVVNAWSNAQKEKFLFAEFVFRIMNRILNDLLATEDRELMEDMLKKMWKHVSLVSQFNIYGLFSPETRGKLFDELTLLGEKVEENKKILNDSVGSGSILVGTLRSLARDGSNVLSFFKYFSTLISDSTNCFDYFVPVRNTIPLNLDRVYNALLTCELNIECPCILNEIFPSFKLVNNWIINKGTLEGVRYIYYIELLQFIASYASNEDLLTRKSYKTVEIVDKNLIQLKEFIASEVGKLPNLKGLLHLQSLSEKLLDVPIKPSLAKYFSMTKDISSRLGKKINLRVEGEDAMINRDKLYLLNDCFTHIIRNSIDHGIEKPEERKVAGKPEDGTIKFVISTENDRCKIEIKDDGSGINIERLKQKALENKFISNDDLNKFNREKLLDLIFISGLSTKDNASDISGRGVGMDIIKNNIEKLGGKLSINSVDGGGTTLSIVV